MYNPTLSTRCVGLLFCLKRVPGGLAFIHDLEVLYLPIEHENNTYPEEYFRWKPCGNAAFRIWMSCQKKRQHIV